MDLNAEGVTTNQAGRGQRSESVQTEREEMERAMKRFLAAIMSVAVVATVAPVVDAQTQAQCPVEVSQAQAMLKKVSAKAQDVQAPRSLAGARQDIQAPRAGQDIQAPRAGQDIQAPRSGQDIQAPRSLAGSRQDIQAPRAGQDIQAPRSGQDVQAPRTLAGAKSSTGDAAKLVRDAEAACKAGKMDVAKSKAVEAMGLMK
jgi:hypothetical protein